MKTNILLLIVLGLLCAGYLIFIAASASLLPERMAVHFGADGEANGWMSRSADLILLGGLGVGMPLLFVALSLLTGLIPARFVNIPHREYWLSPERRAQTRAYISRQMIWMSCLMVLFLAGIHGLTIQSNHVTPPHLAMNLFWTLVVGFLAGVASWSIIFIRHFTKRRE
jgi:uncharacterized membrane protein